MTTYYAKFTSATTYRSSAGRTSRAWLFVCSLAILAGTTSQVFAQRAVATGNMPTFQMGTSLLPEGNFWVGANGVENGLGFEGSYMSVGFVIPSFEDEWNGVWFYEGRGHLSENGGYFFNAGYGRRQVVYAGNHQFMWGTSIWYDFDNDRADIFGHSFHQVGLSMELVSDIFRSQANLYFPVGEYEHLLGAPRQHFVGNNILVQNGIDVAMTGFDAGAAIPVPGLGCVNGMFGASGYFYTQNAVGDVGGFALRLDTTPLNNIDVSVQMTHDDVFKTSGMLSLAYSFGGSPRTNLSQSPLQRTQRNDHIVRQHQDPIYALNPDNGDLLWRAFHVDNTADAGGDGTYEEPFNNLADAETAADATYDIVVVRTGDGTTTGYDTGFVPTANYQRLFGDGYMPTILTQRGDFMLWGLGDDPGPMLTNPAGAAVTLVRGMVTSGYTTDDANTGIMAAGVVAGTGVDSVNVNNVTVMNGDVGINIEGSSGEFVFDNVAVTGTDDEAVLVDMGTADVGFTGGSSITNNMGRALVVRDTTGGTVEFDATTTIDDDGGMGVLIEDTMATEVLVNNATLTNSVGNAITIMGGDAASSYEFFDSTIDGANDAGVSVVGSAATATFDDVDILDTDGAALSVDMGTADVLLTGGSTIDNTAGNSLAVVDTTGGSVTLDNTTSLMDDGGLGILLDNADDTDVTVNNATLANTTNAAVTIEDGSGGSTYLFDDLTITDPTDFAIEMMDNTNASTTFTDLVVTTTAAGGIQAANNMAAAGTAITIDGNSMIDATGGAALDITDSTVDLDLATVASTGSTGTGINLDGVDGTIDIDTTEITSSTGTGIRIVDSNDGVAGTFDFGTTTIDGAGQGQGMELTDNSMATITFNSLNVTTAAGAGIVASDTANTMVVNLTGAAANIDATGGAALDLEMVQGTTNGGAGWTFGTLTSTDSGGNGVRLVDLDDEFTVNGTTTIDNSTLAGIQITETGADAVDFNFGPVVVTNRNAEGIRVNGIHGTATFNSVDIDNANAVAAPAVRVMDTNTIAGPDGDVRILGGTISDATVGIRVDNSNVFAENLNITDAGTAIVVNATGTDTDEGSTVQFDSINITGATGDAITLNGDGTSTLNATITSSNIESTGDSLVATTNAAGTVMNMNIFGNTGDGAGGGPTDDFTLNEVAGDMNVRADSEANFSSINNDVNVNEVGGAVDYVPGLIVPTP